MNYKVNCRFCDRYIMTATSSTIVEGVICSNSRCKAKMNIRILFTNDATQAQLRHKFTEPEQPPKDKENK